MGIQEKKIENILVRQPKIRRVKILLLEFHFTVASFSVEVKKRTVAMLQHNKPLLVAVLMRGTLIRFRPSALLSLLTGKAIFLTLATELFICVMC